MGLDMYAYSVDKKDGLSKFRIRKNAHHNDLHYWRKHHDLHGWMEALYYEKGGKEQSFNCIPVQLTEKDLNRLEQDILNNNLPHTTGFFFGNNPPCDESKNEDLQFIQDAFREIENGRKVYYDSWW
jgi:hypothetical protein